MNEKSTITALNNWLGKQMEAQEDAYDVVVWLKEMVFKANTDKDFVLSLYEWGK